MASRPGSLRRRVAVWMMVFGTAVALSIAALGSFVNEQVENEMWRALHVLDPALLASGEHEASFGGSDTVRIETYIRDVHGRFDREPPARIAGLSPGLHDDIIVGDQIFVVSVSEIDGDRHFVVLDITRLEADEFTYSFFAGVAVLLLVVGLSLMGFNLGGRMIAPVLDLARRMAALDPKQRGLRLGTAYDATEVAEMAAAIDGYLEQLDAFVQRERDFILSAEHELRTPMAVVAGALDVLESSPDDAKRQASALLRIRRGTEDMNETLQALLVLAAAPDADRSSAELCRLDELLPRLVRDHEYLLEGRQVEIVLSRLEPTLLPAPPRIVYIAIGNLLRNSIANTTAGRIDLSLIDGQFVIVDSGSGMSPQAISDAYRAEIRNEQQAPRRSGLGLFLIRRICARYGWHLEILSPETGGTRVELDLRTSLRPPPDS